MWSWLTGQSPKLAHLNEAEKCFSQEQLQSISSDFKHAVNKMPAGASNKDGSLSKEVFLYSLCGLPSKHLTAGLGQALFNAVCKDKPQQSISQADMLSAKARCSRMGEDSAREFCFCVLAAAATGISPSGTARHPDLATVIPQAQLVKALEACIQLALGVEQNSSVSPAAANCPLLAAVASGALAQGEDSSNLTFDGYCRWSKMWPACHDLLASMLNNVGKSSGAAAAAVAPAAALGVAAGRGDVAAASGWVQLPELLELGRAQPEDLLLQPLWRWLISGCLPPDMRKEWRCLFNSQRDGKSYNTMIGRLGRCEGPSLMLIKDKEGGHVMGGFAPAPWAKSGTFFGDYSTFIFGLQPAALMYRATGINENFQWCGLGFSQLPNGCGFGGAQGSTNLGQFALFLDSTLDTGMSRPIATFGNEPLASKQVFQVSVVECWQLRRNEEEEDAAKKVSVLDKAQARNFMGMAGMKVDHSAGLRPEAPIEEN